MTINEAFKAICSLDIKERACEDVLLSNALNRVLAKPIYALDAAPRFNNSAMDGYAVANLSQNEWQIAGETIFAGDFTPRKLQPNECCKIMTGALLPVGAEAVLMVENASLSTQGCKSLVQNTSKALKAGENIRYKAEEYAQGALLLQSGRSLDAAAIALAAANGYYSLPVAKLPRVGVFASGDELLEPYERGAGVYNSNAYCISALASSWAQVSMLGTLKDDPEAILRALSGAAGEFDLLITIGAASKGDADYVKSALEQAGFAQIFSRISLKPGGPVGLYQKGSRLVFTLPGNPMSAYACMQLFASAFAHVLLGKELPPANYAPLAQAVKISNKKENVIFGRLNERGEFIAHNDGQFSSAQLSPITASTHFARLHADNHSGELVQIYAIRS